MSIAVSAVIHCSRMQRAALAVYGAAGASVAAALVGWQGARFYYAGALAAACAMAALAALRGAWEAPNARRIDISGLGEIRLSVKHSLGAEAQRTEPMRLLPGSTVWPALLILLLRDTGNGSVTVLTILPDSVETEHFRKIAVSVRAIARRDNKFSGKNKIL